MNARVSVFSKFGLFFMILLLALGPTAVFAQLPGPANPIDFSADANKDGLPDELVAEFWAIRTMAEGVSAADDAGQAAIDRMAADLLERLPYASETWRLQSQAAALQQQLEASGDPTTSQALLAEMQTIEAALMDDPAVALTLKTLDSVLASHSGPDAAGLNKQVFLPVITTGASDLTDALTAASDAACTGWETLAPGDIMLINGGDPLTTFLYAWKWAHSGSYHVSDNSDNMVYESNLSDGVRLQPLANWKVKGSNVWLGRNKDHPGEMATALTWAEGKYDTDGSTPYNLNFANKWTDGALYCSQLVWKINKYVGDDVDSNAWQYRLFLTLKWGILGTYLAWSGVAPDEIPYDREVRVCFEGINQ